MLKIINLKDIKIKNKKGKDGRQSREWKAMQERKNQGEEKQSVI